MRPNCSEMDLLLLFLLPIFATVESQITSPINQTDLQIAMHDMRTSSYNGFVILLKILTASPSGDSLHEGEVTFLMPTDDELSKLNLRPESLEELILSHSIPSALLLSHLLHFPNGSLVPSSMPYRMLRITNSKVSGLFINNAKIVTPNVCLNSLIRCHGISTTITFDNSGYSDAKQQRKLLAQRFIDSAHAQTEARSPYFLRNRKPAPH